MFLSSPDLPDSISLSCWGYSPRTISKFFNGNYENRNLENALFSVAFAQDSRMERERKRFEKEKNDGIEVSFEELLSDPELPIFHKEVSDYADFENSLIPTNRLTDEEMFLALSDLNKDAEIVY